MLCLRQRAIRARAAKSALVNVIRARLEKCVEAARHRKGGQRCRGTYHRGIKRFSHVINVRLSEDLMAELEALCSSLNVERGVVARDALALYLGLAELELVAKGDPIWVGPSEGTEQA